MKLPLSFKLKEVIIGAIIVAVFAVGLSWLMSDTPAEESVVPENSPTSVSVLEIRSLASSTQIVASGNVEAVNSAEIVAEASGVVRSVPVEIGQTVARGALLANFSASDQSAQVAQAEAALGIQQAQLNDLLRNAENSDSESADAILIEEQQDRIIANAYRTLLNTDLQAYNLEDDFGRDNGLVPTISGVYNSQEQGDYIIETYSSAAPSGVSYRLSGMEEGVFSADVNAPQPLGTRGLQIQFPNAPAGDLSRQRYIVSIPNTRSTSYVTALNAYEAAQDNKEVALQQSTVSTEQIESQRAAVRQAQANVQAARSQLAKTAVRAPFAGTVLSISTQVGEFVSPGQPILTLVSESNQQVKVYLAVDDAKKIEIGDAVLIGDSVSGVVSQKAPGIDAATGKVEVQVLPTDATSELVVGEFVTVTLFAEAEESATVSLPLKAIRLSTTESSVFVVRDGIIVAVPVTTGAMRGDSIEVVSGLSGIDEVIANVRGLSVGEVVTVSN